ncbi:ASCH domain-containing protein [Reyranella massiliensis]|uniref:ASCH domain-containing protein n=1 Tax=Reyranella massiliensis TaxID=445220 RepID=UPI0002F2241E|nr:ASCH domain-containing protein [Reyranella massiliensis]
MKALTIWQPWASLIMAGYKPYEFRGWPAPRYVIGQRIVIHAGTRLLKKQEVAAIIGQFERGEFMGGMKTEAIPFLEDIVMDRRKIPLSAALGTVRLGTPKRSHELWPDQFEGYSDSDRAEVSNWAWPVTEIEHFTPIIPIKGHQSFWNWPYPAPAEAAT